MVAGGECLRHRAGQPTHIAATARACCAAPPPGTHPRAPPTHPLLTPGGACSILPAAPMVPWLISGRSPPRPTCEGRERDSRLVSCLVLVPGQATAPASRISQAGQATQSIPAAPRHGPHRVASLGGQHPHRLRHRLRQALARLRKRCVGAGRADQPAFSIPAWRFRCALEAPCSSHAPTPCTPPSTLPPAPTYISQLLFGLLRAGGDVLPPLYLLLHALSLGAWHLQGHGAAPGRWPGRRAGGSGAAGSKPAGRSQKHRPACRTSRPPGSLLYAG